ncbi:hypothetical protein D3C73_1355770 [compost metagenome]
MLCLNYRVYGRAIHRSMVIIQHHIRPCTYGVYKRSESNAGNDDIPIQEKQDLSGCRLRSNTTANIMSERFRERKYTSSRRCCHLRRSIV